MSSALPAGTYGPAFTRGRIARLASVGALALAGLTCRDSSPLGPGLPQAARLNVTPNFQTVAGGPVVTLTDVVVKVFRLPRAADATPIIDTIAPFVNDTVRLSLSVEIIGTNSFEVRITARAGSDTVYQGTDSVSAHVASSGGTTAPPPAEIDLHWASADTLVTSLRVDPRDTILTVGDDVPFRVTARRADNSIATGVYIGWQSTNPSLTIDQATGVARATAEFADAMVIATMGSGLADTTHVSATRAVGSVVANPSEVRIGVGSTLQVNAVVTATDGTPLPTRPVTWFSANTNIATVSNTGLVTAVAAGTTSIIVSSSGKADTVPVIISRRTPLITWGRPADISYPTAIGPAQLNATATFNGAAVAGTFTYSPVSGTVLNAGPDQSLSVTFVPTDAATYESASSTQLITVLKGVATLALSNLTHTYDGTPKSATVASTPAGLSGIVVTYQASGGTPTTTPPTAGGSYAVTATLTHSNYQANSANGVLTISAASQSIALTPIPDKTLGTPPFAVTATATSGLPVSFGAAGTCSVAGSTVTLESEGTCVISAMQPGDGNWAPAAVVADTFNVLPAPVASVDVQPDTALVQVGQSVMLTAILRDASNGVLSGRTITWTTGDAAIATVNAQTGEVSGVAPGTVQIFATSEGQTGAATVIVQTPPPTITSTVLPMDRDTLFAVGAQRQYAARSYNVDTLVAGVYTWRSTNEGVITVNASFGIVIAVAAGEAQLIVDEAGGTSDTMTIVVNPVLSQIVLSPDRQILYVGDTTRLTASGADALGNPMPLPGPVVWSQFDGTYAASVAIDGLVTGEAVGYSTVVGRVSVGNQTLEARALVEVVRRVARVDVSPAGIVLSAFGQQTVFTATAIGHDGTPVTGANIVWESVNPSVAVIIDGGAGGSTTVKSVRNGVTLVRAWSEGVAGEQPLQVQQQVASLTVSPSALSIDVGGYAPLTAIARDANTNVIPLAPGAVAWTSQEPAYVAVDVATGVVQGVGIRGNVAVIATAGGAQGSAAITVDPLVAGLIRFPVDTLILLSGDTANLELRLNKRPATGTTVTVNLALNGGNAAFVPQSVTFNEMQTSQIVRLAGRFSGAVQAVASTSDGPFGGDTLTVHVRSAVWFQESAFGAMNAGEEATTRLRISEPAPAGGLMVGFEGNGSVVRVTPDPVFIPAGHLAADVVVRGIGAGIATVTPVVSGVRGEPLSVEVFASNLIVADPDSLRTIGVGQYEWGTPSYAEGGLGCEFRCYVDGSPSSPSQSGLLAGANMGESATSDAPAVTRVEVPGAVGSWVDYEYDYYCGSGGYGFTNMNAASEVYVEIPPQRPADYCVRIGTSPRTDLRLAVRSSDPATLAVEESPVIQQYNIVTGFAVHGRRQGDVTVAASAPGWTSASMAVRVTTPSLWFGSSDTILVTNASGELNLDVMVGDSLRFPHPRVNSMFVRLTSSDSTVIGIDTTAVIDAGTWYGYATVLPRRLNPGTAWLRLNAEGHIGDSVLVRVPERAILMDPTMTVGAGLTYAQAFQFSRAPADSVFITVTPLDADSSAVAADTGFWFRDVNYGYPTLQVRGYAVGSRQFALSAPGYAPDTVTVNVVTSNFIAGTVDIPAGMVTQVAPFYMGVGGIGMTPFRDLTVNVTRIGTDTSASMPSTVTVPAFSGFAWVDATGNSAGTSQFLLQAPGFADTTMTVNVRLQQLAARTQYGYEAYSFYVGYLQQEQGANLVSVHLPQFQPVDKVLQVTSLQGRAVPTVSQVIITANTYTSAFFGWNGVTVGTDTIVVSDAAGTFAPDSFVVEVSRGQLAVQPEYETIIQRDQSPTTVFSGYYRNAGDLQQRPLSDTTGFTVKLESSDPAVLTVDPFVRVLADGSFTFTATYVGDGVAWVTASDSALRADIAPDTSAKITMVGPRLQFNMPTYSLGMNQTSAPQPWLGSEITLQVSNVLTADAVVYLTSSDTNVLQVPDSIVITPALGYATLVVASSDTIGVVQVEATSPGYVPAIIEFDVGRGQIDLYTADWLQTDYAAASVQVSVTDQYGYTHPTTRPVTVQLSSSNTLVAATDSVTVRIDSGSVTHTTALLAPLDRGRTNVVASEAGYPALPYYRPDTVAVTVKYPPLNVTGYYTYVGMAQTDEVEVALPAPTADSSDVLVTLRVADASVATVAPTTVLIPWPSTTARVAIRGEGRGNVSTILEVSAPRYETLRRDVTAQPGTLRFSGLVTPRVGDTVRVRVRAEMYLYENVDGFYNWGYFARPVRNAQDIALTATLAGGTQVVKFMDSTGTVEINSVRIEAGDIATHEFMVIGVAEGGTSITATNANFTEALHSDYVSPYPSAATVTIFDGSNVFSPLAVDIAVGGTVTWDNQSVSVAHNLTFTSTVPTPPAGEPNWTAGARSRQFTAAGVYSYQCTNHTGMTGSVVVH